MNSDPGFFRGVMWALAFSVPIWWIIIAFVIWWRY